jgi:hypothetical protein
MHDQNERSRDHLYNTEPPNDRVASNAGAESEEYDGLESESHASVLPSVLKG